jgi:hypothetical protein
MDRRSLLRINRTVLILCQPLPICPDQRTSSVRPRCHWEIALNLKELGYRLPSFFISPDLIAPDGGADI